ncbi:TetR/AcrR family transcriptional regulator [Paracidovorax wautersii]|uniref:DNA-binding transcriptional regulator, AcrR family n=1 Tax=Paracidovorax wautersii TaxID=1177982 RepID=A0A1I2HEX7_9BURK|nr:TetR/AcrR family transcriptional regulator [Paracidovorax wautersii]SFF27071.1 DNA-binding transcriptional regulator, AcrR family [Paracidovorax wautersii]
MTRSSKISSPASSPVAAKAASPAASRKGGKAGAAAVPATRAAKPASGTRDDGMAQNRQANILQAAERLFASRGFHGVSIRDIAEEAGVPLALVGYYYGPKLSLYHAIFRARAHYIEARLSSLERVQREAEPGRLLEEIVQAFVLPVLELAREPAGATFLRLLARGMGEHLEEDEPMIREMFDPLAHAFIDAIARAVPQASRADAAWCYQFALGALQHHVSDTRIERLSRGQSQASDHDVAGPLLVRFITHGIRGACGGLAH